MEEEVVEEEDIFETNKITFIQPLEANEMELLPQRLNSVCNKQAVIDKAENCTEISLPKKQT